jgi:HK97 family phage portal protein
MVNIFNKIFNKITSNKMYDSSWKFVNGIDEAFVEDSKNNVVGDSYRYHPYVNIAVSKIAANINRAKFKILDGDNEVTSGPVFDLFSYVNPHMSRYQLWEATVSWLETRGECIWTFEKDYGGIRLPKEIFVHDPNRFVHHVDKEENKIILWQYQTPEGEFIPFLPSELIHFKFWNPWNEFRGVNPLISHESILSEDAMIDASNISLMKNKSTPSGLLTSDLPINESQAKEYIARWEKTHGGPSRSGRIAVMGSNLKYQSIGLTPAEMNYLQTKKWNRSTIIAKYGVPPVVSGFKDENTPMSGTDTSEQLTQFWNMTLIPIIKQLEDKLETDFTKRWAPRLKIEFNIDDIPELQENESDSSDRLIKLSTTGILTINECRERLGLEPVAWGDTWHQLSNSNDVNQPKPEAKTIEVELCSTLEEPLSLFEKWTTTEKSEQSQKIKTLLNHIEKRLKDKLNDALYEQRSKVLALKAENDLTLFDDLHDYWIDERKKLTQSVHEILKEMKDVSIKSLPDEVNGIINVEDDYYENKAKGISAFIDRLNDVYKMNADDIRELFNTLKHNMKDYVHLEVNEMLNYLRMNAFKNNGYIRHEYISMKEFDLTDGDITDIGWPFANKKSVPVNGFTLPLLKEGKKKEMNIHPILLKEMTEDEEEIAERIEDFWNKQEKEINKTEDKADWLEKATWGLLLFNAIETPVARTFLRGLRREQYVAPQTVDQLKDQFIAQRAKYLQQSGDKVARDLLERIRTGNLDKEELKEMIADKLKVSKNHAKVIAQTETTVAYNTGIQKSIEVSDKEYKQWINAGDLNVRDSHQISQIVPKNEPFTLANGLQVMHPGDGPADEVIGCRCSMVAVDKARR